MNPNVTRQLVLTSAITLFAMAAHATSAEARTNCPAPQPHQVVLFQLPYFQGSCQILNLRADRLPTGYGGWDGGWDFNGTWNSLYYNWDTLFARNSISSVQVGSSVYLTLFYYRGFAGDHADFNAGFYPWVGWIDDQTASLRITPIERDCRKRADGTFRPLLAGEIALYEDSSYGGDCVQWRATDNLLPASRTATAWTPLPGSIDQIIFSGLFEDDSTSSIRVGPLTQVRLCRAGGLISTPQPGYCCETMNTDVWRLANTAFGSDVLSSLKSRRPPPSAPGNR